MNEMKNDMDIPVSFNLDGKTIEAAPGETIWQAAARHGTDIPHLCYRDSDGYRADGNCRACMVEICLLYTSPRPRDRTRSRMPSSA